MKARQGAMRIFWGDPYPAILVPSPAPTSCRKRTGAGLHEHPMRDPAKPGPARRPGAFPKRFARGDGSRDRASDEAGMVGCGPLRRERCSRKKCGKQKQPETPLPRSLGEGSTAVARNEQKAVGGEGLPVA